MIGSPTKQRKAQIIVELRTLLTVEASAGSVRWPLVAYKHPPSHHKIKQKDTCCCSAANLDRRWEAILEGALVAKTREEAALEG